MRYVWTATLAILVCAAGAAAGLDLVVTDEFRRIDPFGAVVVKDGASAVIYDGKTVKLEAAAGGYAAFNLGILPGEGAPVTVAAAFETEGVAVDFYRAWFHRNKDENKYYPDALVPVTAGTALACPAADNKVEGQTCITLWVDIWIPAALAGKTLNGKITVTDAKGTATALPVTITTGPNAIPAEDGLEADHNTYGVGWIFTLAPQYAKTIPGFRESDEYNRIFLDAHRLMYDHRAAIHDLGYNHNGNVQAIFAPQLAGEGQDKRIVSWAYFDRRYGPLCDGTAFAGSRRGPHPIPGLYLPITPEWPALLANWGEETYTTEFVNIVSAMEKHFRAKGWVNTRFEMFFNHKKRHKAFSWDGDETKFPKDNRYFKIYGDLLRKAVPATSPVKFTFRHDASWQIENQVAELKGVVNQWILSGGCSSLWPAVIPELRKRGDTIWVYGGPSSIWDSSVAILGLAIQAWMKGVDGFEQWQFADAGSDPWFNCDGANTGLIFPGEQFGIRGAIPCIRLKLQRDFLQDVALAMGLHGRDASAAQAAALAGLAPADWSVAAKPALLDRDPVTWNNPDIGEAVKIKASAELTDAGWALKLRSGLLAEPARKLLPVGVALKPTPAPVPEPALPPYTPPVTVKPAPEECIKLLEALAIEAAAGLKGEDVAAIMTDWGSEKMFNVDPHDQWAGGDNFDVDHDRYDATKKQLIRLARRLPFLADCNLWEVCRANPAKVQLLIRQLNGFSPYYNWGDLAVDPAEPMRACLKGTVVRGDKGDLVVFFAPIRDAAGAVRGFVEAAAPRREIEPPPAGR
ncbi:MAG: hypothetical protein ABIF71_06355 [Planctomycetota bacterium]